MKPALPIVPALSVQCDATLGSLRLQVDAHFRAPWTVLFGASGSGKSSLLRLIAGLWRPAHASVVLGERQLAALPAHRRGVTLVAQQPALFPHLSIRGNVAFGSRDAATVEASLALLGLEAVARHPVAHLSGGEAQRVCVARALAATPRLLLLDESFTGLHRPLRDHLLLLLRAWQAEHGVPIVSVTHDVEEAFACAGEVLRLQSGQAVAQGQASAVLADERSSTLRRLGQPAADARSPTC